MLHLPPWACLSDFWVVVIDAHCARVLWSCELQWPAGDGVGQWQRPVAQLNPNPNSGLEMHNHLFVIPITSSKMERTIDERTGYRSPDRAIN